MHRGVALALATAVAWSGAGGAAALAGPKETKSRHRSKKGSDTTTSPTSSGSRDVTVTVNQLQVGTLSLCDETGSCTTVPVGVPAAGGRLALSWVATGLQPGAATAGCPAMNASGQPLTGGSQIVLTQDGGRLSETATFTPYGVGLAPTSITQDQETGGGHQVVESLCLY